MIGTVNDLDSQSVCQSLDPAFTIHTHCHRN
jgi:hypothetical protein